MFAMGSLPFHIRLCWPSEMRVGRWGEMGAERSPGFLPTEYIPTLQYKLVSRLWKFVELWSASNQDKLVVSPKANEWCSESQTLLLSYLIRQGNLVWFSTGLQASPLVAPSNSLLPSGACAQGPTLPAAEKAAPSPTVPVNMTLNKCSTNDSHQISCSFAGKRVLFLITGPPGCHVSKPIVANRDAQGPLVAAHGKVEKENRDNGTFSLAPLQLSTMITGSGVFLPV